MVSPYEVLQVDPDADDEAIQAAYRQRVLETHPDRGGSTSEFRLVQLAYEELQAEADQPGELADEARSGTQPVERHQSATRVEYLDYEVVDDFGWECSAAAFERAAEADLEADAYGEFVVEPGEYLLEAAEEHGFDWPYSCRGGACANCAVAVLEGDLSMAVNTVLPEEMVDRGIRLSCIGTPVTDELRVVFNVKHLPELEELRLPPRRFGGAGRD